MGPVADKAKKGQPKAKHLRRIEARIKAWANPESKQFEKQIADGGAKCPGSRKYYS